MGLFSSSKSSTSTSQNITNDTQSADASNIVGDTVLTGKEIQFSNTFDEGVKGTVDKIIDVLDESFKNITELNKHAIGTVSETNQSALNAVSQRFENAEQPELSVVRDLIPILAVGTLGAIAYLAFKR